MIEVVIDSIRISLVDTADSDSTDQRLRPHGVEVDERWWTAARRLAARTYVPASDDSRRRGAGAGLLDNWRSILDGSPEASVSAPYGRVMISRR